MVKSNLRQYARCLTWSTGFLKLFVTKGYLGWLAPFTQCLQNLWGSVRNFVQHVQLQSQQSTVGNVQRKIVTATTCLLEDNNLYERNVPAVLKLCDRFEKMCSGVCDLPLRWIPRRPWPKLLIPSTLRNGRCRPIRRSGHLQRTNASLLLTTHLHSLVLGCQ